MKVIKNALRVPTLGWVVCLAIFILSFIDGVSTYKGLEADIYYEMNPVMLWLSEHGLVVFLFVKQLVTAAGLLIILNRWKTEAARYAAFLVLGAYTTITAIHTYGAIVFLGG